MRIIWKFILKKKQLIKKLISQNKLTIGPWYVVPDTLIPSGESLIKNLSLGYQHIQKYGGKNSVGYSPDSFGIASQIPQLFSLFGYQAMHYCRGQRCDDGRYHGEVVFCSPDGSDLLALYDGYCSGHMLSFESVWKNMFLQDANAETIYQALDAMYECHHRNHEFIAKNRLLIVGIDHAEPKNNLTKIIHELNQLLPNMQFIHSSQESFFESLQNELKDADVPKVFGEQRGPYDMHFTLSNTLSARMDIKLLNRRTENLLERYASPLQIFTNDLHSIMDFNTENLLEFAWKTLIQNHAHDSICACSVDEVLNDIQKRLRDAYDIINDILMLKLQKLTQNIKANDLNPICILVYNPLPYETSTYIDQLLKIPYDLDGENFVLCEADGTIIPCSEGTLIQKKRCDIETEKVSDAALLKDTTRIPMPDSGLRDIYSFTKIRFQAQNLPACGYRCFYLKKIEKIKKKNSSIKYGHHFCENSFIRIDFKDNGCFHITDKRSGIIYEDQNLFEETEDEGDTYTYSPGDVHFSSENLKAKIAINNQTADFIEYLTEIKYSLPIPENRSHEMKICSYIRMINNSDVIYIKTTVYNNTYNHRLRASFTILDDVLHSLSDTAFDIIQRPIIEAKERTEKSILTMPMRNLLYLPSAKSGYAFLSASPQEYECIRFHDSQKTTAYVTLLRSVESVYKTVTLTKNESNCGAGTRWWTNDAKMLGEFTAEYAIKPCDKSLNKKELLLLSEQYQYQPVMVADYADGNMNYQHSYCQVTGCSLSSVTKTESGILFRVININEDNENCEITINLPFTEAFSVDFTGKIIASLNFHENKIVFRLTHNKIMNILIHA